MKKTIYLIIILILLLVIASEKFKVSAKNHPIFATVDQLEEELTEMYDKLYGFISENSSRITEAENKLDDCCDDNKSAKEVVFFEHGSRIHGERSNAIDTKKYNMITFDADNITPDCGYYIYFSDNQIDWTEQSEMMVNPDLHYPEPLQKTLIIKGKYYQISVDGYFTGGINAYLY